MAAVLIPGYNRILSPTTAGANDFPHVAVSDLAGTVSIVWNNARRDRAGDILLLSYTPGGLAAVQTSPVRVNPDTGGWHVLPALRYANQSGRLSVSYYQRASPNTALTDIDTVLGVDPRTTSRPAASALAPIKVKRCIRCELYICEFYIMRAPHRRCYAVPGWGRADRFGDAGPPPSPSHNPERGGRPPLSLFPAAFPRQWPAPLVATAFWARLSITLGATDGGPGKARHRYFILGGV